MQNERIGKRTVSSIGVEGSNRWPVQISVVRYIAVKRARYDLTLQHIDVVQLKTRQTVLDGVEDMLKADVV